MGKRVAIISLLVLVTGLVILIYLLHQGRRNLYTDPYKAISPGATFVIETVDLQSLMNSFTSGKGIFGEAGEVKELDNLSRKMRYITDQLNKSGFKKLVVEGEAVISFHPNGEGRLKPLLSMAVPGEIRYRQLKEVLHLSGISDVHEGRLNNNSVLKTPYIINNIRDTVFFFLQSGLMVCSNSKEVLAESIIQMGSGSDIRNMPGFSRVLLASGKNEDKIFVVFSNLFPLVKKLLSKEHGDLADRIARLAGTAEGDIYITAEGLILSGYTECPDSSQILYKYKFLDSQEFQTYKILPSSTVLFETLITAGDILVNSQGRSKDIDLAVKLKEYCGEEITRAYVDIKEQPVADNTLLIYELADRIQAEQFLVENQPEGNPVYYFEPDDQIKIPVYKSSFTTLIGVILPDFAPDIQETYFTFYDNFLITGNSIATISKLLYDNLLNKTLANDLTYRDFESTLPSRSGYLFYCVPSRITDYLSGFINDEIINILKLNKGSISKIQAAGYQLASSNDMIYNSLSIRFKEEGREESTTEWETLLDTIAGIKPFFFTNHNTGAKEIFIQDTRNNTYLINAAGRVLWKVPLRERIKSTIYMIDYYRNGKYQLLFSGRNYLHILDRNGNYVERYPVRLRSPATNPLALFDYDNNNNYRLFIAGEDKLIYSYDKTGNVVKGWKPYRTSGNVNTEINYFKVSGKDYIVASDDISIYFLDRTGNKRLSLKEAVSRSSGSAMKLIPGSEPFVVCTSPDGTVQQIYFDGTIKTFRLRPFSSDHSFDIFDVDGDGFGEYIFIDKGILYLYDHNRSEMFTKEFGSGSLGGPINFIFSATDRKIGVFDINNNLIYLIDKNGETMNDFPLRGASMFSIGKLSDRSGWHLIVGGTDRFLYNYKIGTGFK